MRMTCRDVTGFLADYLAGELAGGQQAAFEAHLDRCGNCRRYLAQYRQAVALAASVAAGDDALPPIPEELVAAVRASLAGLDDDAGPGS